MPEMGSRFKFLRLPPSGRLLWLSSLQWLVLDNCDLSTLQQLDLLSAAWPPPRFGHRAPLHTNATLYPNRRNRLDSIPWWHRATHPHRVFIPAPRAGRCSAKGVTAPLAQPRGRARHALGTPRSRNAARSTLQAPAPQVCSECGQDRVAPMWHLRFRMLANHPDFTCWVCSHKPPVLRHFTPVAVRHKGDALTVRLATLSRWRSWVRIPPGSPSPFPTRRSVLPPDVAMTPARPE
jgi:hypothetical protein